MSISNPVSVLRSPWGRGKRRTEEELDEVQTNGSIFMIPDSQFILNESLTIKPDEEHE